MTVLPNMGANQNVQLVCPKRRGIKYVHVGDLQQKTGGIVIDVWFLTRGTRAAQHQRNRKHRVLKVHF